MKHFDIIPPKKSKKSSRVGALMRFFLIALTAMGLLFVGSIWTHGTQVLYQGQDLALAGYGNLRGGVQAFQEKDFEKASLIFEGAYGAFDELEKSMHQLTAQSNELVRTGNYLSTANSLIEIGKSASAVGQDVADLITVAEDLAKQWIRQNLRGQPGNEIMQKIQSEKTRVDRVLSQMLTIRRNLVRLQSGVLPGHLTEKITSAKQPIDQIIGLLAEFQKNYQAVLTLLGDDVPHRYLVLFQNRYERRATGGFIGSYALVDINDGVITKLNVNDVYASDGQLAKKVDAPPGIDQVADQWYMRDANYSPDFPTSAQKIMWFLEQSRGPSVDSVIAIDQSVAQSLLSLVGPIQIPGTDLTVNAENFSNVFSFLIEAKVSDSVTPKEFLINFVPQVKEKLLAVQDYSKILTAVSDLLDGKHIQLYSSRQSVQKLAQRLNIDGQMVSPAPETDFLAVVSTSIGGNKSDRYVATDLNHQTQITRGGSVIDTLTIQKTHTWKDEDFQSYQPLIDQFGTGKVSPETLRFILGEGPNRDYIRVYVPKGSQILSAKGVDQAQIQISEDQGYTVFAWPFTAVEPGKTESVTLEYWLPFKLSFVPTGQYKLITQSQAGADQVNLKKTFALGEEMQVIKQFPTSTSAFSISPVIETPLNQNQIVLSLIKP